LIIEEKVPGGEKNVEKENEVNMEKRNYYNYYL